MSSPDQRPSGLYVPKADTRITNQPFIRAAVENFCETVDPEQFQTELANFLSKPLPRLAKYDDFVERRLIEALSLESPELPSLPYSVDALNYELLGMNHPDLLLRLFGQAVQKKPTLHADLVGAFLESAPTSVLRDASLGIAGGNVDFLGGTLIFYGTAAAYGKQDYPHAVRPNMKMFGDGTASRRYKAGEMASNLFDEPATSTETVIGRLQQLFPSGMTESKNIPALRFVRAAQAFTSIDPNETPQIGTCPAQEYTGMMFAAYGNVLAEPAYQQRIKAAISLQQ